MSARLSVWSLAGMGTHRTTREEAETTITFNRHQGTAECCTADPTVAKRWERVGWPVEVLGRYTDGEPRTWQTWVSWRAAVRFSRLDRPKRARPAMGTGRFTPKERSSEQSAAVPMFG